MLSAGNNNEVQLTRVLDKSETSYVTHSSGAVDVAQLLEEAEEEAAWGHAAAAAVCTGLHRRLTAVCLYGRL